MPHSKSYYNNRHKSLVSPTHIVLNYTPLQDTIFCKSKAKYIIASCGRRSGKTFGAAQFLVETMMRNEKGRDTYLWVDVAYRNIGGYVDTYFLPILDKFPRSYWEYKGSNREIRVFNNQLLMRSADRPDLLVGAGYKIIILNEAGIILHEGRQIWHQIILPMMLDYPDSRAFLIGTPRGIIDRTIKKSLYFEMFQKGQKLTPEYDPQYESYKFSSYDNPLLAEEDIKKLEEEISPLWRQQELYGEFVNDADSMIFNPIWWKYSDTLPDASSIYMKFLSLDTAFSDKDNAAESAITCWIKTFGNEYYIIDCWHDRVTYPDLVAKTKSMIVMHSPDRVVIENKASGQSLIQTLQEDFSNRLPITAYEPGSKDKVTRAAAITGLIESGRVFLYKAHWNEYLINQATLFPNGDLADVVDTISQALGYARNNQLLNANSFVSRKVITKEPQMFMRTAARHSIIPHEYPV